MQTIVQKNSRHERFGMGPNQIDIEAGGLRVVPVYKPQSHSPYPSDSKFLAMVIFILGWVIRSRAGGACAYFIAPPPSYTKARECKSPRLKTDISLELPLL